MASDTTPRNSAPTTVRAIDSHTGPPAWTPPATRPTRPMAGAIRSSAGGNSGDRRRRSVITSRSMPVISVIRADRTCTRSRWCSTPALRRAHETPQRRPSGEPRRPTAEASRTGAGSYRTPTITAPSAISAVHASQQPAVADRHLATPGRDPQEEQSAHRPLEEEGGDVEVHGPRR